MLRVGDKAPDFDLESDDGGRVRLSDLKGRRVVLYFYPKDSTPGCTREAQDFTKEKGRFDALGVAVFGVSKDSVRSHCSFRDKYALAIPLLSDPTLEAHKAYGAFGEKMMYGKKVQGTIRSTFVIDEQGVVAHVFPSVKVDGHAEKVLGVLGDGAAEGGPSAGTRTKTRSSAPRVGRSGAPGRSVRGAAKKGAAKKAGAKKAAAKKGAKKAAVKKAVAKKAAVKKAPRKAVAKKAAVKKAPRKAVAKKSVAKTGGAKPSLSSKGRPSTGSARGRKGGARARGR